MVIRLGVLGFSEGNGHPFSFSAIVNGFDDDAMAHAGWPVIHRYLRAKDPSELGRFDARVVAAWMPDPAMTRTLCDATNIANCCHQPEQMLDLVDAVMLLRDDPDSHRLLAAPFLARGIPVFVDKPLATNEDDLTYFQPHLVAGRVMSCAGLRYARELDEPRAELAAWGDVRLVRAAVLNDWERYGIHVLEAALAVLRRRPVEVAAFSPHEQVHVRLEDDSVIDIVCLGTAPKTFRLDFFGTARVSSHDLHDNFTAFSRTIGAFLRMVSTREPSIPPDETLAVIETILAGRRALGGGGVARVGRRA